MSIKPGFYSLLGTAVFALLFVASCSRPESKAHFETGYFDLGHFMDGQVVQLAIAKTSTTKGVFLNGKTEQKDIAALDSAKWRSELASFYDADINKPAYVKRYAVDTVKQGDSVVYVQYKAMDDDLRTRELKVYFKIGNNEPVKIEAELRSNKIFYHSHEVVSYDKGVRYDVAGKQDVVFAKADTFAVHAVFANHP